LLCGTKRLHPRANERTRTGFRQFL
jgi:preprotein translocase SecE subunit